MNGVPLRRVNQAYVIATSVKVDVSGVKVPDNIDDKYFTKAKEADKLDEDTYFSTTKKVSSSLKNNMPQRGEGLAAARSCRRACRMWSMTDHVMS